IKQNGSLRRVQHKRDGRVIGELDLYDLLLKGDSSNDNRMQPGDVIFIPPVGQRVGIDGEIYRPGLYELDGDNTLGELIDLAGGMTPQAYPQRVTIERTNNDFLRIITEADLTRGKGKQARILPGDTINIASISDITRLYVELKGAATRPGNFAWVPGIRVSSLVKSLDTDLLPIADKDYAAIVRTHPETDHISVLNLRLRAAARNPGGAHDLLLHEKDRLLFFSDVGKVDVENETERDGNYTRGTLFAPVIERLKTQATPKQPQQTINISGPVRYPGEYPLPASGNLADAVFVAGGLKDSASLLQAEVARYSTGEDGVGQTQILNVDLGQAMNGNASLQLRSRDRILIKAIPEFGKTRTITLSGEVRYPGSYTFRDGETLKDILQRAGGLTQNAYPKGAVFTREKLRQLEAQRLREAEERLQGDLLGIQLEGDSFGGDNAKRVQEVQGLLDDVQESRAVGRMVIDLPAVLANERYQSIRLQDGDQLTVPVIPQAVTVVGEVQYPTSHLHTQGLTVEDYLERSGGPPRPPPPTPSSFFHPPPPFLLPHPSPSFLFFSS
ncbi:MAG: SLBB domain-containing protein, partial [Alteromonadaceae bacterium]|nr:SLBB domain-containing protein [Alteromonadaceae bacterium]